MENRSREWQDRDIISSPKVTATCYWTFNLSSIDHYSSDYPLYSTELNINKKRLYYYIHNILAVVQLLMVNIQHSKSFYLFQKRIYFVSRCAKSGAVWPFNGVCLYNNVTSVFICGKRGKRIRETWETFLSLLLFPPSGTLHDNNNSFGYTYNNNNNKEGMTLNEQNRLFQIK